MRILLAMVVLVCSRSTAAAQESPNIVIFLADDQGWGDAGCYGHPVIRTPNIDKFAKQGVRLTNCYSACSVCSPSRSAILTGRTPYRNGVWRWIPEGSQYHLRSSEITVASLLKKKGYATCHVGKWHLNGKFNSPDQPQPSDHGFDWWFATQGNAAPSHKNPTNFVRNGKPVGRLEGYSALLVVDEAIAWLKKHRDTKKPFFLTVWTHEPHIPIESDPKYMALYKEQKDAGLRQHHGNITQLDAAFGNLMKAIDESNVVDNTFVFYTSDNGPAHAGTKGRRRGSTGGLRGRKGSSYEGGIRVPGIVRWPGHVKPGTESDEPVIGSDVFTTACEIAGVQVPSDRTIDGASMVPLFSGKPIKREQPLYWRNHTAHVKKRLAMRVGDWKILGSADYTHFELYNLKDDWQEKNELSSKHPDILEKLKKQLIAHNKAVLAEGPDWWKNDKTRIPRKKYPTKKIGQIRVPKL